MDYDQIITSSLCDAGCMADSFIAKCTASEYPFCQTISFPGSIFDYFCGPVSYSTPRPARTTYEGETDGREFVTSVFSNNILGERPTALSKTSWKTRPSSTRTNPSSSAVSKSSSSSSTSTSIRPASTPSAASEKSSTPIGAIVGGVLGGLAVLGPIALGALCILRRKPPPSADSQLAYQTDPLNELPADAGVYQPFYEELPSDDRSRELPADDPAKYSGRTQPMVQTYHTVPPHASSDQQYPGNTQPGTVHEIGE
ncbi:hypothetical protein GE09DRAFT_1075221 [Coniochaeta sp. 2T2.1]|nr:hypothetical protein GE09DRAFT_1075221 [Coniochaeta sp. 2T2.1]